jgi:WS/DGAT/MGAT family acyltransferase
MARFTADAREEFFVRAKALADLLGWAVQPASDTPLNGRVGPHRRFDYLVTPLSDVKRIAKKLGSSVNDVVLSVVTGAVRDFLVRRRVRPDRIDFRVSAPVSVRRDAQRGEMGNHVSAWIVRLPIDEADPMEQLERIRAATDELKRSRQALGVETMMAVAEWTPSVLLSLGARAASGPINMIVTNVPGPQMPLYLLGCRLLEVFPQVPLLQSTGVGVALFSYDGKLCWGFNADYELVPDLRHFVRAIETALGRLATAAGVALGERAAHVIELRAQPPTG